MDDIVIVAAARTPVGSFNGAFATVPAHVLGTAAIQAVLARTGLAGGDVDEVILGQVLTTNQGQNPARQAARAAGVPDGRYPGVMVNFDNTARRQWQSDLWLGSNPYTFRRWLRGTVDALADRSPDQRIVFVNAWNEWAECAVLEPTQRFGRTFLLATRDALRW